MAIFYDTHAHLDYPEFAPDFPQILERAHAAGIAKIISIGTDLESSARAVALAEKYDSIYAVVGWHPTNALDAPDDLRDPLRQWAAHPKVVAIGETGLDYHRLPSQSDAHGLTPSTTTTEGRQVTAGALSADDECYKLKQAEIFRQQMEVAAEFGLNCVVHQRDALEDTIAQMQPFVGRVRGVFHCFANDAAAMKRIIALGSLVSFTGILTFKNGQNIRDTLAETPLDQFMLETDCPYLAPIPYRGKRCEPGYVKEISEVAAQVKNCSLEELSIATCATARNFFRRIS
ncbi:MAG: TatD family hydrolase [Verrucomicrobiota bacterium]